MNRFALAIALLAHIGAVDAQLPPPDVKGGADNRSQTVDSRPVEVRDETCSTSHGYGRAAGWLVNRATVAREARLTVSFLRGRDLVDTLTLSYFVPAGGKTAFDVTGRQGNPDRCTYNVSW